MSWDGGVEDLGEGAECGWSWFAAGLRRVCGRRAAARFGGGVDVTACGGEASGRYGGAAGVCFRGFWEAESFCFPFGEFAETILEGDEELAEEVIGEAAEHLVQGRVGGYPVAACFICDDFGDVGPRSLPVLEPVFDGVDEGLFPGWGVVVLLLASVDGAEGVAEGDVVGLREGAPGGDAGAVVGGEFVSPFIVWAAFVTDDLEVVPCSAGDGAELSELDSG